MELSFRQYGEDGRVILERIHQVPGMHSIVTAVYDMSVSKIWSRESITRLKQLTRDADPAFEMIRSVPVYKDIKLDKPSRDQYIANYYENIRRVAKTGIKRIYCNLMSVFDWIRTQLDRVLEDGSIPLVYYQDQVDQVNPMENDGDLTLPGWDPSHTREGLKAVMGKYNALPEGDLWADLKYFPKTVILVAVECDMNMAIHENDPRQSVFDLPRIITCEESLGGFSELVDDKHNSITLYTGSLDCSNKNSVVKMTARYAAMGRIHFICARNVAVLEDGQGSEERTHLSSRGASDMFAILEMLYDNGFNSYMRPDHGCVVWGETGRAGYGLYDRILGVAYLNGLQGATDGMSKQEPENEIERGIPV